MGLGLLNVRKGLLQLLLPGLKCLPPRRALGLVGGLARAEYHLNVPLKLRYDRAVERAAAQLGCTWDVQRVAGELAANQLRWRTRDLLLDDLPNDEADRLFRVVGRENLDAALAKGRGVLLLFNHYGACLMPAHWLVRNGYPLRWFTERPRAISKVVERTFTTDGPLGQERLFMSRKASVAEGGTAIRRAVRILEAGMIVQVAGDVRWSGPRTAAADFIGNTYTFTTTWITIAALSGAPVLPAFGRVLADGTYEVEFLPEFSVPSSAARSDDLSPWVREFLAEVEERVRRDPTNSAEYFFWSSSDPSAVPPAAKSA